MEQLWATVSIKLLMREGETEDEVNNRLYDLLYEGLSLPADHRCDFWIESAEVVA